MALQIEVGATLMDDNSDETTVVSVKGRWVKLEDGRNISREQAAEWIEFYRDSVEGDEEGDEEEEVLDMSKILSKYRGTYVKVAKASGRPSLDKGDEVATALRDLTLGEVLAVADLATKSPFGTHQERYTGLNVGSQRMNAGNRIRAVVKKGETNIQELLALLALSNGEIEQEEA